MSKQILSGLLLSLLSLAAPLAAQTTTRPIAPADFAWQWPIATGGADGVVRFTLTPDVYARVTRSDLGDLAAFNAAGESIPIGPAALAFERLAPPPPPPAPLEVALFRVPREADSTGDRIALHIARGADGRLTRLDAEVAPETGLDRPEDVLLDVSSLDLPVTALRLELGDVPPEGLNARVEVAASDDLARWQILGSNLALVALTENGLRLERNQLEFAATERPYLRLRRSDASTPLPIRAVLALPLRRAITNTVEIVPARQELALQGRALAEAPGSFEFLAAGPFPVERINVELGDRNAVAGFVLESRDSTSAPWQERTRGTAFRLGGDADDVASAPLDLAPTRDAQWRLRTEPAQTRSPTLTLSYRPEQFVLLTQGSAPYRLVAGSRDSRRPDYPLRTVLSEMRSQYCDLWLPLEATLGTGAPLSGDAALTAPPPPPPYKRWLLWGVLIGGALLVVTMVLKLLRNDTASESDV